MKWDKSAETALSQIKEKRYPDVLEEYAGNLIVAGIAYDKAKKRHECLIEKL